MRPVVAALLILAGFILWSGPAAAFTRTAARYDGGSLPSGLAVDCTLESANLCAGWIWVFNDVEGAVWGSVLTPADCPISCTNGGSVEQITLYSRCSASPGRIGGVGIYAVDGVGCRTSALYESPPISVTHCVSGDRWTTITTSLTSVNGNPFAVTVTWGPQSGGSSNPQLATDNGIANLYCHRDPATWGVFPGCATSMSDCTGWAIPPQRTYIYVTDFNGDGQLDDICALYGAPYPLAFPYVYPYGYLPNNLIISAGLSCFLGSPVEETSWGGVKVLFH